MKERLEALIAEIHGSGILFKEAEREFRKKYIRHVLKKCRGNQCVAARELGIHRNSLNRAIHDLDIDPNEFRPYGRYRPAPKPVQPAALAAAAGARRA